MHLKTESYWPEIVKQQNSTREGDTMFRYRPDSRSIPYPARVTSIFVFVTLLLFAKICTPFELLIGTEGINSFSYFAGKTICRSIKKYQKDITCQLAPTAGAADRLTNLQNDSIDLALISSKTIHDAFHNTGSFRYITFEYNDLRLLMPYYRSPISLIARRDAQISKLDDLTGKRVNSGVLNTLENQVFKKLMTVKQWNKGNFPLYQNLSHAFSQDSLALKSGSIQAMLHIGMHPDNSLMLLLSESHSTLVGLDDRDVMQLVEDKAGFSSCLIAAGTYPGLTEDINTLAMETLLVASAATADDTVQLVLSALFESKPQLQYAHPALLRQQVKVTTLNESYLHPHPSALLFFQAKRNHY
jgi:TRAP transporter TAXI family solute receptor